MVGSCVGDIVGFRVGEVEGLPGVMVGFNVGSEEGALVGEFVGC